MNRPPTGIALVPTTFDVVLPGVARAGGDPVIGHGVVVASGDDAGKIVVTLVDGTVSPPMLNGPNLREWCWEQYVRPTLVDASGFDRGARVKLYAACWCEAMTVELREFPDHRTAIRWFRRECKRDTAWPASLSTRRGRVTGRYETLVAACVDGYFYDYTKGKDPEGEALL